MPTFVLSCSQGTASCAALVRNALAGSVDVRVAPPDVDVFQRLMDGECDGVVLHLEEARAEAAERELSCQVIAREERRDVLLCSDSASDRATRTLGSLPAKSAVGVMGTRRLAFLRAFRPDVEAILLGEDLTAAMDRLSAGDVSTLIASGAEIVASGAEASVCEWLEPTSWVPSAGGGGVGLILPPGRGPILVSPDVVASVLAEETMITELAGASADAGTGTGADAGTGTGTGTGVGGTGALGLPYGPHVRLWGLVVSAGGTRAVRADLTGSVAEASELGRRVARALLSRGAQLTAGDAAS